MRLNRQVRDVFFSATKNVRFHDVEMKHVSSGHFLRKEPSSGTLNRGSHLHLGMLIVT